MVQHCFRPIPTIEFVQSQMIWPCLVQKLQIHQLLCLPKSAHYLYSDIYQPLLRRGQIICSYTNPNAEIGPKQHQTSGLLRYFFYINTYSQEVWFIHYLQLYTYENVSIIFFNYKSSSPSMSEPPLRFPMDIQLYCIHTYIYNIHMTWPTFISIAQKVSKSLFLTCQKEKKT